jgi:hypothetical protein
MGKIDSGHPLLLYVSSSAQATQGFALFARLESASDEKKSCIGLEGNTLQ